MAAIGSICCTQRHLQRLLPHEVPEGSWVWIATCKKIVFRICKPRISCMSLLCHMCFVICIDTSGRVSKALPRRFPAEGRRICMFFCERAAQHWKSWGKWQAWPQFNVSEFAKSELQIRSLSESLQIQLRFFLGEGVPPSSPLPSPYREEALRFLYQKRCIKTKTRDIKSIDKEI